LAPEALELRRPGEVPLFGSVELGGEEEEA
jgi:hypothetical protein